MTALCVSPGPARWVGACLTALGLTLAPAQAGNDKPPAFSLATVSGKSAAGPLVSITADGSVTLGAGPTEPVTIAQWLTLRRSKIPLPAYPRGSQVLLTTGDRIPLAEKGAIKITDDRLHCQPHGTLRTSDGELRFPLGRVVVLWLGGPDGSDPSPLLQNLLRGARKKDVVTLRNGDRLEGNIVSLDSASGCVIDLGKKRAELPWVSVAAIAFSTELLAGKLPAGLYYHVVLDNGARLEVKTASLPKGAGSMTCRTLFGAEVEIPLENVIALEARNGAGVYLSDLKPLKYEQTPFLGPTWPLIADASVSGGALTLGGSTFDKGLGMHAESRVVYALDGHYSRLEALVGLDPEHGKKGRVLIRVLLDGKEQEIGWKKELTAAEGPLVLRLDVAGARELTLEVLCGSFGDVQAHVNWADARLIKKL